MAEYFCFKSKDVCGTEKYIDIPGSQCINEIELAAYPYFHGGSNQQWRWDKGNIISSISPKFCLAVHEVKDGSSVILHCRDTKPTRGIINDKWILKDGVITLANNEHYHIGLNGTDKIVLRSVRPNHVTTKWKTEAVGSTAKPASSCHLQYQPIPQSKIVDSWTLENTVCIRHTANCTYFCVVGWGPGGYSGIQQIDENHKVAIFSMWNDGAHSVKEVEHGNGVAISSFGGEGTGMKAMKEIQWERHQKVTFRVSGVRRNNGNETVWRCACWYSIENGEWNFMAAYERSGNPPFDQHFYSFVEDWKREGNCEGHIQQRSAEFSQPKVITGNGETIHLKEAIFTKQSEGDDMFGHWKAFGAVKTAPRCFLLSTGGDSDRHIFETLTAEGCQQNSSNTLTKLCL